MSDRAEELKRIARRAAQDAEAGLDFGEVLGRARAKARGQACDPDRHHPDAASRSYEERVRPEMEARLSEVIQRFRERGRRGDWAQLRAAR